MMINRGALLLRYKEPFAQWVNSVCPEDLEETLSLEELNSDRTIYLVDDSDVEEIEQWVALNFSQLFESELEDWSADEATWPADRSIEKFNEWCSIECHGLIIDTVGTPIDGVSDMDEVDLIDEE